MACWFLQCEYESTLYCVDLYFEEVEEISYNEKSDQFQSADTQKGNDKVWDGISK